MVALLALKINISCFPSTSRSSGRTWLKVPIWLPAACGLGNQTKRNWLRVRYDLETKEVTLGMILQEAWWQSTAKNDSQEKKSTDIQMHIHIWKGQYLLFIKGAGCGIVYKCKSAIHREDVLTERNEGKTRFSISHLGKSAPGNILYNWNAQRGKARRFANMFCTLSTSFKNLFKWSFCCNHFCFSQE